ncbi:LytR family transcriptional regulator [Nakamurella antarctica]|uniref:LytR family transcriptional regulator n=1 Tax=Nakamurella antarctica TaxID=1902245 RepID=A0A3G8ZKF9_9ACTN|nr:LytR C-terminal domain-containing protein [Nakamurella antarctica]AZI57690.1 LytR family transcriptional regulator [Nakamurella antarctica]
MSTDSAPVRYRRRRRWPALTVITLLAIAAAVIWITALQPKPVVNNACNEPALPTSSSASGSAGGAASGGAASGGAASGGTASGGTASAGAASTDGSSASSGEVTITTTLGTITDKNTLAATRPANPATVPLRVLNASLINGLAGTVTEQFRKAGFQSIQQAKDDNLYPARDLRCYGEIRYGAAGLAAARAVLIVAPCATLVVDSRIDDSVELSIGALYQQAELSPETLAQLKQATNDAKPPNVIEGQTAARTLSTVPALPQATCPS